MLHAVQHINGRALWANLHLLFWLSLVPFVTGWVNENHFAAAPVALYGFVLLMSGISYYLLVRVLIGQHSRDSALARAMGKDIKGMTSLFIYIAAIALTFVNVWVACALYIFVAIMWFIPDPRIERALPTPGKDGNPHMARATSD